MSQSTPPSLERVVEAMVLPAIEYSTAADPTGQHYARMINQLASSTDERSVRLLSELFDVLAEEATTALEQSLPGLRRADSVSAYLFTLNICNQLMSNQERFAKLSTAPGSTEPKDLADKVVKFLVAGIRSMAALNA